MSATNRDPREIVREETLMRRRVLETLADGPRTVPEIAEALGRPTHEAMFWVMGLRRYGWIRETKDAAGDGYFRYQAVERERRR
jgi:predicted Rossmann fold nucleotide-binding protein DprA/Smf involved in DNA uptake